MPPLSLKNERKVLEKIYSMAKAGLNAYPTTYQEDLEILKRDDLTFNQRNCVLFRSGEKEILIFLINATEKFIPLLDMDFKVSNI